MSSSSSLMLTETYQTPGLVRTALARDQGMFAEIGAALRARPPHFVATIARGSSDNAAAYAASAIGILTGRPSFPLPIAAMTRYGVDFSLADSLVLVVSQSGASPDSLQAIASAKRGGARIASFVNAANSAVAAQVDWAVQQHAGPERSVAATKTFILSAVALVRLVAAWSEDAALNAALPALPERLDAALACDWSRALPILDQASGLYVIARGPTMGIAREAALKFKETVYLHAEAVSAAEIRHGPRAIVDAKFPLLAFDLGDAGGSDSRAVGQELGASGAPVMVAAHGSDLLPLPAPLHPLLDPIVAALAFYPFVEALSRRRGIDPDQPRGLRKITETL